MDTGLLDRLDVEAGGETTSPPSEPEDGVDEEAGGRSATVSGCSLKSSKSIHGAALPTPPRW